MHSIEPFYNWRDLYIADEDENSPFYERSYSEFEFSNSIYNYVIHPQWDEIGSPTLYLKILFADYTRGYAILEMFGEWNDCINNDIMFLKREIAEVLISNGINKFILIGENVLNFHPSDDCYYEEWFDELEDAGWIAAVNFREHVLQEMRSSNIDYYINFGGEFDEMTWRNLLPLQFFKKVEEVISHRLS
jgi:hypothetical protein